MHLPAEARRRLSGPLRLTLDPKFTLREMHSVPVVASSWANHLDALTWSLRAVATAEIDADSEFSAIREAVEEMLAQAEEAVSHLLALQPFEPFDGNAARRLVTVLFDRLNSAADSIDAGVGVDVDPKLVQICDQWDRLTGGLASASEALAQAFGMASPPADATGQFRADWVLQHYAYRTGDLLRYLLPHLTSLGVPGVTDVLAAVTLVGEVVACEDPVTAYIEMESLITLFLGADVETGGAVRAHLDDLEPAMRRARDSASRAWRRVGDGDLSAEERANSLAECYRKVVEGPFRQFVWAKLCLRSKSWSKPPTLGPLRDQALASGGRIANVVSLVVIPELRNGEAHETFVWDGFSEMYLTEGAELAPGGVASSTRLARAVVAGCESGMAAVRFLVLPEDFPALPTSGEEGRMPSWRRVQAYFGTNRIRVTDASLNSRAARVTVESISFLDINPCLQALVLTHRMIPAIESFKVQNQSGSVSIEVSAEALGASMAAWEYAVTHLDRIPLSTFLPANVDARRRYEDTAVSLRAGAWIAVDDALGVFDGADTQWRPEDRALAMARLKVVELAIEGLVRWGAEASVPRLDSAVDSIRQLRTWVGTAEPSSPLLADNTAELSRLRIQWAAWGPVRRHPAIADERPGPEREPLPAFRAEPGSWAFRTF